MDDIELKSCPFCGAIPIEKTKLLLSDQREVYIVTCDNLDCSIAPHTNYFLTREGARNAWNRRLTMAEYIEREEVIKMAKTNKAVCRYEADLVDVMEFVNRVPTADVRPERHGRWVAKELGNEYYTYTSYFCSECGRKLIGYSFPSDAPYCHCGAKMDGEDCDNR